MMHLARLARLYHEADGGAQPRADQVVVHGGRGEQRRDRDAIGADQPVGQDDDVVAALTAWSAREQRRASAGSMPSAPVLAR